MQTTMTTNINDRADYIELLDSNEPKTSLEPPNYSLCSDTLPPSLILQLSHDMKTSNNSPDMTSAHKNKTLNDTKQHNAHSSLPDNKSRSLPVVKPPYYNVLNELGDAKGNIPLQVNSRIEGRRSSYGEVLIAPTSPERNSYTEFNAVLDHYDTLAPVQRLTVPIENLTNSQHNANAASKKCVGLAVCCIIATLFVVLAATLVTFFHVSGQSDPSLGTKIQEDMNVLGTKMSSFQRFQEDMNVKVWDTLQSLFIGVTNASDIKVVYADRCFCLYRQQLSWQDAKDFCLAKGFRVHLAEIYNKDENDFLMPILHASSTPLGIWLGGSDLDKDGTWVWNYTGRQMEVFKPSQWALGQPKESCLDVYALDAPATFKWKYNKCTNLQPFLCESQYNLSKCFC